MALSRQSIIEELWGGAHYRALVVEFERVRPIVPQFNYQGDSNIEEIKFKLAQQQMFDLALKFFKPEGV